MANNLDIKSTNTVTSLTFSSPTLSFSLTSGHSYVSINLIAYFKFPPLLRIALKAHLAKVALIVFERTQAVSIRSRFLVHGGP